jgi:hypothetical protein
MIENIKASRFVPGVVRLPDNLTMKWKPLLTVE